MDAALLVRELTLPSAGQTRGRRRQPGWRASSSRQWAEERQEAAGGVPPLQPKAGVAAMVSSAVLPTPALGVEETTQLRDVRKGQGM